MVLKLYKVNPKYLKYLRSIDNRVSFKNSRPFVGVLTMINGVNYVLPLTSQTTEARKLSGKKKRPSVFTTFVKNSSNIGIANILHNNMIPVSLDDISLIRVNPTLDSYKISEIRYIRKNCDKIINKATTVYLRRINNYNDFYVKMCCDFKKLEEALEQYKLLRKRKKDKLP